MSGYVSVYSLAYSVIFTVEVTLCQSYGAFRPVNEGFPFNVLVALLLLIVAPIMFFAFALPRVQAQGKNLEFWKLVKVQWWIAPVYALQQTYIWIATTLHWIPSPLSSYAVAWWVSVIILLGIVPIVHVACSTTMSEERVEQLS